MHLKIKHIKPYLFILLFLLVPLLLYQVIKIVIQQDDYIDNTIISNEQVIFNRQEKQSVVKGNFGIVIHGGAGNITKKNLSSKDEVAYKTKLFEAVQTGMAMIKNQDSAIYIVQAVIKILEDSPLFNAGKGAVFNSKGTIELDASIMDGRSMNAGAVAGVQTIKNPISAALSVMQKSKHVLLSGKGADDFAKIQQLETVTQKYFYTEKSWNRLQKAQIHQKNEKHGTVGCVVLDKFGNLAAGTSTGGMTNKSFGRVGDSPIIGAGTYADNNTCAISCTGVGEYFIRYSIAYDISARMKYKHELINEAVKNVIDELTKNGGSGGVIGIDTSGNIGIQFNTKGMFRAYSINNEEPKVHLYKN